MKRGEDLLFVAEVAISKKNDVAEIAGKLRLAHEVKQRGHISVPPPACRFFT